MIKKPPLTKSKKHWVKNRSVILRGEPLNYNASHQVKYLSSLRKLIIKMTEQTKKELMKLFKSEVSETFFYKQKENSKIVMDESISSQSKILLNKLTKRFSKLFSYFSKKIANKMVSDLEKISKSNLHSSLKDLTGGLSLKTSIVTPELKEVSKALIEENVELIQSIPNKYFKDITGSVMRSITSGNGLPDLVDDLSKYSKSTQRNVKLMALDQTRKAYNSINKQKMQELGFKKFEWLHTGGSIHPRESHLKIDGHIFSFENLEKEQADLGVPEADRGIPGRAINCRCRISTVIDFTSDENNE